jgi:hypothetical protein
MGIVDCTADVFANGRQYTVRAATLPPGTEQGERIEVSLAGLDPDGEPSAAGSLTLPPDGLAAVGRLLQQIMTGLSTLNGRSRGGPTNAQAPWTQQQDEELLDLWVAAGDTSSAPRVRRELADHFGRSLGAIKARLARVGCDPDAPGRVLTPAGART